MGDLVSVEGKLMGRTTYLDTINDAQSSVRVPLAHVTSMEPPALLLRLEDRRVFVQVGTLVVPARDARTADEDLALRKRLVGAEVASLGDVDELHKCDELVSSHDRLDKRTLTSTDGIGAPTGPNAKNSGGRIAHMPHDSVIP